MEVSEPNVLSLSLQVVVRLGNGAVTNGEGEEMLVVNSCDSA